MDHSPTPWFVNLNSFVEYLWSPTGELIIQMRGPEELRKANASFIVRAVNTFELMCAALEAQEMLVQRMPPPFGHACDWCSDCVGKVTALRMLALIKAEGK